MAESQVISGLLALLRTDWTARHCQDQITQLQRDIKALQAAINILAPEYAPRSAKGKFHRQKNSFFKQRAGSRLILSRLGGDDGPITTSKLIERRAEARIMT